MPEPLFRDSPRSRAIRVLSQWIEDGILPANQALPTERELADRLDLPRSTVARAIDAVILRGLVRNDGGHTRTVVGPRRNVALAGTVAVVGCPLDEARELDAPNQAELVTIGALAELRAQSLDALVLDARRSQPSSLLHLVDQGIAGVLVTAGSGRPRIDPETMADCLRAIAGRGVPAAIFGDESGLDVDHVAHDHEDGARRLTALLLGRGCRRPLQLFSDDLGNAWTRQRRAGYERAMRQAGLEPLPPCHIPGLPAEVVPEGEVTPDPELVARHVLGHLYERLGPQVAEPPDGLVLLTDYEGAAVRRACALLGRDPPMVGYDAAVGAWAAGRRWDPAPLLATVDKRLWQCGREMVRLMQWRQDLGVEAAPRRVVVEPLVWEAAGGP